jgi:uncharacterized protein YigE (DUF2233 family)
MWIGEVAGEGLFSRMSLQERKLFAIDESLEDSAGMTNPDWTPIDALVHDGDSNVPVWTTSITIGDGNGNASTDER